MKYINNQNIGLSMLNRSKLHLNRFATIQLVKNYRKFLKHGKPANKSVSILKPVGPSSPCKSVKISKVSDNNLIQSRKSQLITYES